MTESQPAPIAMPLTTQVLSEPCDEIRRVRIPPVAPWAVGGGSDMRNIKSDIERVILHEYASWYRRRHDRTKVYIHWLYGVASDGQTYTYIFPDVEIVR